MRSVEVVRVRMSGVRGVIGYKAVVEGFVEFIEGRQRKLKLFGCMCVCSRALRLGKCLEASRKELRSRLGVYGTRNRKLKNEQLLWEDEDWSEAGANICI